MQNHLTNVAVGSVSGLGAAVAGAPWWVVATLPLVLTGLTYLLTCLVYLLTYRMILVLVQNPRTRHIETPLGIWRGLTDPEEPPDTS